MFKPGDKVVVTRVAPTNFGDYGIGSRAIVLAERFGGYMVKWCERWYNDYRDDLRIDLLFSWEVELAHDEESIPMRD